jgi:hypothetical protein
VTALLPGHVLAPEVSHERGDVVRAACQGCGFTGLAMVEHVTDHCADAIGGLVLLVVDLDGQAHVVLGHDVAPGLEIVDVELPDPAELHTSGCVVWTSDNPCDCGAVDR